MNSPGFKGGTGQEFGGDGNVGQVGRAGDRQQSIPFHAALWHVVVHDLEVVQISYAVVQAGNVQGISGAGLPQTAEQAVGSLQGAAFQVHRIIGSLARYRRTAGKVIGQGG